MVRLINIGKYSGVVSRKNFYAPVFRTTIDRWEEDRLSEKAMLFLLKITTGILREGDWELNYAHVMGDQLDSFRAIDDTIQELIAKGYAKLDGKNKRILIRNDPRVSFPEEGKTYQEKYFNECDRF